MRKSHCRGCAWLSCWISMVSPPRCRTLQASPLSSGHRRPCRRSGLRFPGRSEEAASPPDRASAREPAQSGPDSPRRRREPRSLSPGRPGIARSPAPRSPLSARSLRVHPDRGAVHLRPLEVERTGQLLENAFENPLPGPVPKTIKNAVPAAEFRRKIPPRRSGLNPLEHRFQEKAVAHRRPSRRAPPAGKYVLDPVPHSVGRDKPAGFTNLPQFSCFDFCFFGICW